MLQLPENLGPRNLFPWHVRHNYFHVTARTMNICFYHSLARILSLHLYLHFRFVIASLGYFALAGCLLPQGLRMLLVQLAAAAALLTNATFTSLHHRFTWEALGDSRGRLEFSSRSHFRSTPLSHLMLSHQHTSVPKHQRYSALYLRSQQLRHFSIRMERAHIRLSPTSESPQYRKSALRNHR